MRRVPLLPKRLPDSLLVGLRGLGYREMTDTPEGMPPTFRNVKHSRLFVEVSAPRTPGSEMVTYRFGERRPPDAGGDRLTSGHVSIDSLLTMLRIEVDRANGLNVFMTPKPPTSGPTFR